MIRAGNLAELLQPLPGLAATPATKTALKLEPVFLWLLISVRQIAAVHVAGDPIASHVGAAK